MYDITMEGIFQRIKAVEKAIHRPLKDEELNAMYFVRPNLCCINMELIVAFDDNQAQVVEFFELEDDVQEEIIAMLGVGA